VDNRERNVFDTLNVEMKLTQPQIDYEIKTLTVGDYAIIENRTETLIAIFERKTLESDFPASIRDGRYENKEKMILARQKTKCRLYYLVEGPLDPPPDRYFSRIPYKAIESAMFHLEVRDGFHIMRTKDIKDTIQRLIRFIRSLETIDPIVVTEAVKYDEHAVDTSLRCDVDTHSVDTSLRCDVDEHFVDTHFVDTSLRCDVDEHSVDTHSVDTHSVDTPLRCDDAPTGGNSAMDILTEKHEKRDIDILREMWSTLRGISISSADSYLSKYTLKSLVRGEIIDADIKAMKTPQGRLISKTTKKSLLEAKNDPILCEKLLSKIPGIGPKTAKELLAETNLGALLSYEPPAISIMKVGKNKKRLGESKANNIIKFFELRFATF
jgi:ERCC4-type nuclease